MRVYPLRKNMKISVIGYSGSGKSTLAKELSEYYDIKALFLDTVHWLPGWKERPREDEIRIVSDFLNTNDSWVIDGNYSKVCYERRLCESDIIIYMAFNRFASLNRIIKRYKENKGRSRFSMTDGCVEKIDRGFLSWVLYKGRSKKYRDLYKRVLQDHGNKVIVIKNQKQLDAYRQRTKQKVQL